MKVAVCAIGKLENKYIREWVEYYKVLGVSKIFLYDNNDIWGESFYSVIEDYINSSFVYLINYRGKKICQCEAYQDCLDKHYKEYDWICFFDCDEFLTFTKDNNIIEYLSRDEFYEFDEIKVNFLAIGDNNLLNNDSNSVLNVFKKPLDINETGPLPYPNNLHAKTIIKCSSYDGKNIKWIANNIKDGRNGDPHFPNIYNNVKCCNNSGKLVINNKSITINNRYSVVFDYDLACLRHYSTKTITEFILNKFRRGFPDQICNMNISDFTYNIGHFFSFNKATHEKLDIVKQLTKELFEDKHDKVVVEARGRIGNTLFTLACGAWYAYKTNRKLYLYVNHEDAQYAMNLSNGQQVWYTDWMLKNEIFKNVQVIYTEEELHNVLTNAYIDCYEKDSTTYCEIPENIDANVFIHGFRQCAKYLDRNYSIEFFKPSIDLISFIHNLYKIDFENTVSINIRRGDFLNPTNSWIMYVNPEDWYWKIINTYPEGTTFLFVSDDIEWCKETFKSTKYKFIFNDYNKDDKMFVDLFIQTYCKDNIISNSTFSWWAAYMNIHKDRKVYYHSPWYLTKKDDGDIIPENDNWINIQ